MAEKNNDMLQLGGLWQNTSKKGEKYLVGYLGNLRLIIFKNKYKKEEKHPSHIMYLAAQDFDKEDEQTDDILDDENDEDVAF